MNFKSERGITGIDITVAILVITIFISLIGALIFSIQEKSKSMERRTDATYYAVDLIEQMKAKTVEELETMPESEKSGYIQNTPYTKKIEIIDYKDITEENKQNENIEFGMVKKVIVTVSYKDGTKVREISLPAIIAKNGK